MELKLNIYNNNDEIVKTYTSNTFRLRTGVTRKIIKHINIEPFFAGNNQAALLELGKVVVKEFDTFVGILMQIFPGLTEEECDNTDTFEIALIIFEAIKFAFENLSNTYSKKK